MLKKKQIETTWNNNEGSIKGQSPWEKKNKTEQCPKIFFAPLPPKKILDKILCPQILEWHK